MQKRLLKLCEMDPSPNQHEHGHCVLFQCLTVEVFFSIFLKIFKILLSISFVFLSLLTHFR